MSEPVPNSILEYMRMKDAIINRNITDANITSNLFDFKDIEEKNDPFKDWF